MLNWPTLHVGNFAVGGVRQIRSGPPCSFSFKYVLIKINADIILQIGIPCIS